MFSRVSICSLERRALLALQRAYSRLEDAGRSVLVRLVTLGSEPLVLRVFVRVLGLGADLVLFRLDLSNALDAGFVLCGLGFGEVGCGVLDDCVELAFEFGRPRLICRLVDRVVLVGLV